MAYKPQNPAPAGEENKETPTPTGGGTQAQGGSAFIVDGTMVKLGPTTGIGSALGVPVKVGNGAGLVGIEHDIEFTIPAIAQVTFVPTFGVAVSENDPINVAMQNIIRDIQTAMNRSNLPFQGVDVMLNCMATDSLYMLFEMVKKGQKLVNSTNAQNLYYVRTALEAAGFDYDDFDSNLPEIRSKLVEWSNTLKSYPMPKKFNTFAMHQELVREVFVDDDSPKAQSYIFVPQFLWSYAKVDQAKGLQPVKVPRTWREISNLFDNLIGYIMRSDDFNQINSALQTTYGTDSVGYVPEPELDLSAKITRVYNQDMLDALECATLMWCDPLADKNTMLQVRDTGYNWMTTNIVVKSYSLWHSNMQHLINGSKDFLSPVELANNVRWSPAWKPAGNGAGYLKLTSCTSEFITGVKLFKAHIYEPNYLNPAQPGTVSEVPFYTTIHLRPDGSAETDDAYTEPVYSFTGSISLNENAGDTGSDDQSVAHLKVLKKLAAAQAFAYFPIQYLVYEITGTENDKYATVLPFTQWRYIASVDHATVETIHRNLNWKQLYDF